MGSSIFPALRAFIVNVMHDRLQIDTFEWDIEDDRNFPLPDGVIDTVRRCILILVNLARLRTPAKPCEEIYFVCGYDPHCRPDIRKIHRIFAIGVRQCALNLTWISVIRFIYWTCSMASWIRFEPFYDEGLNILADMFLTDLLYHEQWFQNNGLWEGLEAAAREIADRILIAPSLEDEKLISMIAGFEEILYHEYSLP